MILQIAICLLIYFIFYLIQNSNYVFSEDVINKTKEILSYDIDVQGMCSQVMNEINSWSQGIVPTEVNSNEVEGGNTIENNVGSVEANNIDLQGNANLNNSVVMQESNMAKLENDVNVENISNENGVGGASVVNPVMEQEVLDVAANNETETKEVVPQSDDEYIKSNFSFIKPVEGRVSSEFGVREVTSPIVSKNHTGIDIAANTGTVIKAAMEGTVSISSTVGEYGYHIQITNRDVSTLYAHCSKLYVKEGDFISQGQEIAEVRFNWKIYWTSFTF